MRVCLVDDDALVLAGMRRTLRVVAPSITLTLAESGAEALRVLDTQPIDVLVSDLSMPGMNGQTLMATVQSRFPDVARVICTGALDPQESFTLQLVTHRAIVKPVDVSALHGLLQELCHSNGERAHESAHRTPCDLPWAAAAAERLHEQDARSITADVARENPALAMLLLQSANAGFVPCGQPLDVHSAVRALGPVHLSIMHEALWSRSPGDESVSDVMRPPRHRVGALLALTRDIAERLAPLGVEALHDEPQATNALTIPDFIAIAESAALLRAAVPAALSCALPDRQVVLHAARAAACIGVPPAVIQAVRDSVDCSCCERLSPGAAVRWALTLLHDGELQQTPCMRRVARTVVPAADRERWRAAADAARRCRGYAS